MVLNTDNDEARRMVEKCYRTNKTLVNPIVDWSERDVWRFLKDVAYIPSCELYAEGWKRLGCIGCPLASASHRWKEFQRWPKYKEMYLRAFDRMLAVRVAMGKSTQWKTAEEVFDWWMERKVLPGQIRMDEWMEDEDEAD